MCLNSTKEPPLHNAGYHNVMFIKDRAMDQDKVEGQIRLLAQIVRCICLKKELSKLNPAPELNFWRVIQGGLLDLSVMEWTKVFGSNVEPTHWKGVVEDQNKFRAELLDYLDITEQQWSEYWSEMKTYRDEAVAHYFDNENISHYPRLDIALKSCHFYYGHLIIKLREKGENKYPDSLEEYCERFTEQTRSIAELAIEATNDIEESVW